MAIEKICLGAGCFWGVQHILRQIEGVTNTTVGYLGGSKQEPSYQDICTGSTGHAEVVLVEFDNGQTDLYKILDVFWRLHDPTQVNRQGVDIGTQYRSAIFTYSDDQTKISVESKKQFDESGVFSVPSVTEITKATTFYPAEDYHQDYYVKKYAGGTGPICHVLRDK